MGGIIMILADGGLAQARRGRRRAVGGAAGKTSDTHDHDVGDTFVFENKTWRIKSLSGRVGSAGWATAVHVTEPPAAPRELDEDVAALLVAPAEEPKRDHDAGEDHGHGIDDAGDD